MNEMNIKKKDTFHRLVLWFVLLQPIIDLDYLFYSHYQQLGIPRIATVVRFVVLPCLILYGFYKRDTNKKKTLLFGLLYAACLGAYFLIHHKQAVALLPRLDLTDNFTYRLWDEITYFCTLVFPYGAIYLFYQENFEEKEISKLTLWLSYGISISILLGDLFLFAFSTYEGNTVANIFTWFQSIYDVYSPRRLASKFFFKEGNTLGILLFMMLAVLYGRYFQETDKKEKKKILIAIVLQSFAMVILSTRIATYGTIIMPLVYLVLYLFHTFVKKEFHFNWKSVVTTGAILAIFACILPFSPAVKTQELARKDSDMLLENEMGELGEKELQDMGDLEEGSDEYLSFYTYMFETYGIYGKYINSVPDEYYMEYYDYHHDPKFWCDVTFMPVFDRVNGRQIETIFFNYKNALLSKKEKLFGFGYSTFMNGSIVLEKDFKQQVYTMGYLGALLTVGPWILCALYGLYELIRHAKKLFNFDFMAYAVAVSSGFAAGWVSGHTLDQFLTSIYLALLVAVLLRKVSKAKVSA